MRISAACLALAFLAVSVAAETAPLVDTVFRSENGGHSLEIWPIIGQPGHCRAELRKKDGDTQTKVWSRHLINNYAPVRVFVADDGASVVTMDEWGGHEDSLAQFALVIYGFRGALVRAYNYSEIPDWSQHAIVFFGPKNRVLFVRLDTGRLLMFDLGFGDVMDSEWFETHKGWAMPEADWKTLQEFGRTQIKERALRNLADHSPWTRQTAVRVCEQEKYREAIPKLRGLLADTACFTRGGPPYKKVYYVRGAAKTALEALGEKVDDIVLEEPDVELEKAMQRSSIEPPVGGDGKPAHTADARPL